MNFQAQNPDELTIVENEQLEVVGDGDGKKKNKRLKKKKENKLF